MVKKNSGKSSNHKRTNDLDLDNDLPVHASDIDMQRRAILIEPGDIAAYLKFLTDIEAFKQPPRKKVLFNEEFTLKDLALIQPKNHA